MQGTIAELIPERGFGFISDMDGRRYFFHRGALMGVDFEDLAPGQNVEFMARPPAGGDGSRTATTSIAHNRFIKHLRVGPPGLRQRWGFSCPLSYYRSGVGGAKSW